MPFCTTKTSNFLVTHNVWRNCRMCLPKILFPVFMFAFIFSLLLIFTWPLAFLIFIDLSIDKSIPIFIDWLLRDYSEHILSIPWSFIISRFEFYCTPLPKSKNVIKTVGVRHFSYRRKQTTCSSRVSFANNESFPEFKESGFRRVK